MFTALSLADVVVLQTSAQFLTFFRRFFLSFGRLSCGAATLFYFLFFFFWGGGVAPIFADPLFTGGNQLIRVNETKKNRQQIWLKWRTKTTRGRRWRAMRWRRIDEMRTKTKITKVNETKRRASEKETKDEEERRRQKNKTGKTTCAGRQRTKRKEKKRKKDGNRVSVDEREV